MKIVQWNLSKEKYPMTALKKYEDNLYNNIIKVKPDIDIVRVKRPNKKLLGSTVISWLLYYNSKGADVIHATFQTLAPAIFKLKIFKKSNFVVTVHDLAPLRYPQEIRDASEKIQWLLTPKALKRAEKIIAISEFTKDELMHLLNIDEQKIVVVHQGVDTSLYRPLDKEACKKRFGLDLDKKYVLYVASNLPHKRLDLAKSVFEEVKKCRDDVAMLKAGYSEKLKGKGIINIGWVDEKDMPKLYNCADVYLHTSEYEGFGLPVLEAMACGVRVVAFKRASIPEVVGNSGILAENLEGLVEGVLKALECKGVDKRALNRSKEFSWEKTARKTIEVYLSL